jgi:hypothetical protein
MLCAAVTRLRASIAERANRIRPSAILGSVFAAKVGLTRQSAKRAAGRARCVNCVRWLGSRLSVSGRQRDGVAGEDGPGTILQPAALDPAGQIARAARVPNLQAESPEREASLNLEATNQPQVQARLPP